MTIMNRLSRDKRVLMLRCLTEGMGVNATCRTAGVSKMTLLKLLSDLGPVLRAFQAERLTGLRCKRVQVDEAWGFCSMKAKNVPDELRGTWGFGDIWTWTAICAECRIVPTWLVGPRDGGAATAFMLDVASRLTERVQLSSDGLSSYLDAVETAFGVDIDFAQLVKIYGEPEGVGPERKYSPGECCGTRKDLICGKPDPKHITTSYSERLNHELRNKNRRLARLTTNFSRKVENLDHSLALTFFVYNFVKPHGSLRVGPAMEAGVTDHLWTYEAAIALLEATEMDAATVGATRKDRRSV